MIALADRLLPDAREDEAAYRARGGYRALDELAGRPEVIRERIAACGLTGLGGAHFPFAAKVGAALAVAGPRVVVVNGAEDEPGSQKDRALLERSPHAVLEGALLAAAALDADDVVLYVRETLPEALDSVELALSEGVGGPTVRVVRAPVTYVAGEASAAIRWLEGEEAKPVASPPFPTESGYRGRPTVVANAETLANLPRMLREEGAGQRVPTRLATVTGDVTGPGVFEVDPDTTTLADLVELAGGVVGGVAVKAVQPGGPSSAYLPGSLLGTVVSNEAIRAAGSQPGCLAVRVISEGRCMVEEVADVAAFFAREQCGQCPGCRMKTSSYSTILGKVRDGAGSWEMLGQFATIDEFVADLPRRCALIDMPTPPVMSAVQHFRDDFAGHIEHGGCAAAGLTPTASEPPNTNERPTQE